MKSPRTRCRWSQNAHATCDGDVKPRTQHEITVDKSHDHHSTTHKHFHPRSQPRPVRSQKKVQRCKEQARFRGSGGNRQGDSAKDLLTESRQVSTVAQEKKKKQVNLHRQIRHSWSTSPATSVLPPVSWVLLIEKANLSQKNSLAVVSQSCGLH